MNYVENKYLEYVNEILDEAIVRDKWKIVREVFTEIVQSAINTAIRDNDHEKYGKSLEISTRSLLQNEKNKAYMELCKLQARVIYRTYQDVLMLRSITAISKIEYYSGAITDNAYRVIMKALITKDTAQAKYILKALGLIYYDMHEDDTNQYKLDILKILILIGSRILCNKCHDKEYKSIEIIYSLIDSIKEEKSRINRYPKTEEALKIVEANQEKWIWDINDGVLESWRIESYRQDGSIVEYNMLCISIFVERGLLKRSSISKRYNEIIHGFDEERLNTILKMCFGSSWDTEGGEANGFKKRAIAIVEKIKGNSQKYVRDISAENCIDASKVVEEIRSELSTLVRSREIYEETEIGEEAEIVEFSQYEPKSMFQEKLLKYSYIGHGKTIATLIEHSVFQRALLKFSKFAEREKLDDDGKEFDAFLGMGYLSEDKAYLKKLIGNSKSIIVIPGRNLAYIGLIPKGIRIKVDCKNVVISVRGVSASEARTEVIKNGNRYRQYGDIESVDENTLVELVKKIVVSLRVKMPDENVKYIEQTSND